MSASSRALAPALLLCAATSAGAYPSMVKHNYASCAACHVDPSGAGIPTAYGRVQEEQLLEMTYGRAPAEPSAQNKFLLLPLPEWMLLEFSFRGGALLAQSINPALAVTPPPTLRPLQMATDLRGAIVAGPFRASASLGFALRRAEAASLTATYDGGQNNLVSREHWLGVTLLDDSVMVRAGRVNLPFGLRNVEHNAWVRSTTRTDINDNQQHGVAVAYNVDAFRAEAMLIAGNFQVSPDYYRERGYAAFAEWAPLPNVTAGVSSLVALARLDTNGVDAWPLRQAHGVFARAGLGPSLALLAEANALVRSTEGTAAVPGYAAWLQADWEPLRGLHALASLEAADEGQAAGSSVGAWLGVSWFAYRAVELRIDAYARRIPVAGGAPIMQYLGMAQLHLYP